MRSTTSGAHAGRLPALLSMLTEPGDLFYLRKFRNYAFQYEPLKWTLGE